MRKRSEKKSVLDKLTELGFVIEDVYENVYYGSNNLFRLIYCEKEKYIYLGIKKTFDKWSNSTDFEFKVPKSERSWNEIYALCVKDVHSKTATNYKPKYINRRLPSNHAVS